jgi:probable HAF family extracellular repeat protein
MFREFTQGFVWRDGIMQALGALHCPCTFNSRHGTSRALAVNSAARIVGDSRTNRANFTHAFLWQGNVLRDLIPGLDGASDSTAYGISDVDEIVGEINGRAFVARLGVLEDLGVLPGDARSSARGVNNKGQVVGTSFTATGIARAVLWDLGRMRALGTLPGDAASEARAVNIHGDVVGRSGIADLSSSRAVVWQNGVPIDLNGRISVAGWLLTNATSINDIGQIVGVGLRAGQARAFLLNP